MDHEVVVIGAGFSGIGAAIKLDQAGFRDFVVLEAGDGVGGAWHWNTYPGIAVDIPSFSYQFSFEKRSDWSRVYAPGTELKAYAEHCVDKYGVRDRIQLNTEVVGARFDEGADAWHIQTANGEQITARYVVGATGVFSQPKPPEIEGLDSFAGTTMHTARWDHSVDLRGKRVGVIGTGASAIQLIPAIAPEVEQVTVFQRTPIWCLPKLDAPMSPLARRVHRAEHLARRGAHRGVELGQAPDRRALKDGHLCDFGRDRGDDLDRRGAGADHGDTLAAQVGRVIPSRCVHGRAAEGVDAGDLGRFGLTEHARRADHEPRCDPLAVCGLDVPRVRVLVEPRPDHLGVQSDASRTPYLSTQCSAYALSSLPGAYTRDQSGRFSNENW